MGGSPVPEPSRSHDVSGLTAAELERTKRDLQASLALARPGSAACVPILAHLDAIFATTLFGANPTENVNPSSVSNAFLVMF